MKKVLANDFIRNHKYINYCECIIYRNGMIAYAVPSHIEALIREYGVQKDILWAKLIPVYASPIVWLVDHTKCIAVWNKFCYAPEDLKPEQKTSLKLLIEHNIIKDNIIYIKEGDLI